MKLRGIKLAMEDVTQLVDQYYHVTDQANQKSKTVWLTAKASLALYEDAIAMENDLKTAIGKIEKLAKEFESMGVKINPSEWQQYRDVESAIKDINLMKKYADALRRVVSTLD